MNKKEIEGLLCLWIIIGFFVCIISTMVIADTLDLGIHGKQLFHSEDLTDVDIDPEHKESIQRALDDIANTFGGDPWIQSERFDFIVLPKWEL